MAAGSRTADGRREYSWPPSFLPETQTVNDPRLIAGITLAIERASAEAVATLRNTGITALLIKGPPQQAWLAPAGFPRASVDVDLLVDPSDVSRAEATLSALGYGLESEVTPGVEHHASLWRAAGRVAVEIHRTLPGTDPRLIWSVLGGETETAEIAGEAVPIPNEAARCLIVALHAAHHGAGESAPLYDLERAVNVAAALRGNGQPSSPVPLARRPPS